jgi:hypothetical protein
MKVSSCCLAPDKPREDDDLLWSDLDICPECGSACRFKDIETKQKFEWEYVHCNWVKVPVSE